MGTKEDLSVAYSPGVAEPCLSIQRNERYAYEYTAKGHLVGVITNGTAVLGLGNIGPLAGAQDKIKGVGLCKPTVGLWTHRVKWFCYLPPPPCCNMHPNGGCSRSCTLASPARQARYGGKGCAVQKIC
jgi:Malic enzyme, N-terminal domain